MDVQNCDSRSNDSRDIRAAHFVMDDDDERTPNDAERHTGVVPKTCCMPYSFLSKVHHSPPNMRIPRIQDYSEFMQLQ